MLEPTATKALMFLAFAGSLAVGAPQGGFRFPITEWMELGLSGPVKRVTECSSRGRGKADTICGDLRIYEFDSSRRLVSRQFREEPHWEETRIYRYDPARRQIRIEVRGAQKFFVQLDSTGLVSGEQVLGDLTRDTLYVVRRDSLGRILTLTGFYRTPAGDSVFQQETHLYDTRGNPVRVTTASATAGFFEDMFRYTYDRRGRILEVRERHVWRDTSVYRKRFQYDRQGRKVQESSISQGQTVTTRFTYDLHGNWVKKVVVVTGGSIQTTDRVFEYAL